MDSRPAKSALRRSGRAACSSGVREVYAAVKPVRRKRISPGRKVMSLEETRRWRSTRRIGVDSNGDRGMEFFSAQAL